MDEKEMTECINESFNYSYADAFIMEDMANRVIMLNSEVDEGVIEGIVYHILRYNRVDRDIEVEDRKPIILYINSPGGSVHDGFGLIDAIEMSKTPVYTVNLACCDSMAFLIFIAGKKRFCMPHSEFLLHDGFYGDQGSMNKVRDRVEFETHEFADVIKDYVLTRTKISKKLYDAKSRCEFHFLAHKAKELGVTDFIIGENCSIDDIV